MSRRASPSLIGAFVLGAAALVVAGVLVFGTGELFTTKYRYVTYFEGSVTGLNVGAPVEMRGVKVGSVTGISVTLDAADLDVRIPVLVDLVGSAIPKIGRETETAAVIRELVRRGMRAELQTRSLVTGLIFVELNFHEDVPPARVAIDPATRLPELPTVPSVLQQVAADARAVIDDIAQLPLDEIVVNLNNALTGINQLIQAPELRDTIGNLNAATQSTNALLRDVRGALRGSDGQVVPLAATADEVLEQMRSTLERIEDALSIAAEDSPVRYELSSTLQEVGDAARAMRVLADYLTRNPDALLYGKGTPGGS